MWKQSGQFKKDLRKYQNDREKMKSLETVLVQLSEKGKVDDAKGSFNNVSLYLELFIWKL